MNIVFITSHRLGDAVISTALLSALQERFPTAFFTIVCGGQNAALFENFPRCARLIVMEKERYNRHWLKLWLKLAFHHWDMVVDLRSSIISLLLWSRKHFFVKGGRRSGLKIHQQARALGFDKPSLPRVWLQDGTIKKARHLFPPEEKWLALAPTAGTAYKMWPAKNFIEIGNRFQKLGYKIIVLYGAGQKEYDGALPLLTHLSCHDYGGGKTISDVAACLACCALFIGNDSGLMHLSGAVGTPTIGLFGPSKASQYAPSGSWTCALSAPGEEGQGDMKAITVEDVFCSARLLLKQYYEQTSPSYGENLTALHEGDQYYAL